MTSEQFCYWLQGYSEIVGKAPDNLQWLVIHDHLQEVFNKTTPQRLGQVVQQQWPFIDPTKVTLTC